MKVLLTGGGTMGSVTPLLAVAEEIEKKCQKNQETVEFFWIGSWKGPEREFIQDRGIKFYSITAGKLRR
jgi:UDP-N-acetylglucosamine--N-acetylmuramyl-(pentapeptide) pyrophosphoryl-undecaprenol N-acetylglucosamine transferase